MQAEQTTKTEKDPFENKGLFALINKKSNDTPIGTFSISGDKSIDSLFEFGTSLVNLFGNDESEVTNENQY